METTGYKTYIQHRQYFKILMPENFPKLTRDIETPIEGVLQIPSGKRNTHLNTA